MLTLDEFASLQVGDVVEAGPLFKGLSKTPVQLEVAELAPDRSLISFEATYFGIRLGAWSCRRTGDRLKWEVR